jgi:hypothetical protein
MTLDFADFCAKYAAAADLRQITQDIKTAVAPFPVHVFHL